MPHTDPELNTWQEIGAHLGVSGRTAQKWEKTLGLPVRRMTDGPKARVVARIADLDRWKAERMGGALPVHGRRRAVLVGGVAAAVLVSFGIWLMDRTPETPNSFQMSGKVLTVFGASGKPIWQFTFPSPVYNADSNITPLQCKFADLDGRGPVETVCIYHPTDFHDEGSHLYCFDARGRVRWVFKAGATVRANNKEYDPPYSVAMFVVLPKDHTGRRRIAVSSLHSWSYPNQVAILNDRGELVGQYWHHGHLLFLSVVDINGDGKKELVLGGLNDSPGYKRATVVVFDPDRVSGSSLRADGRPDFDGMGPGSEQKVVFFPKTRVSANLEFNWVHDFMSSQPGRLTVSVSETEQDGGPYALWELGQGLRPQSVVFSNALKALYRTQFGPTLGERFVEQDTSRLLSEVIVAESSGGAASEIRAVMEKSNNGHN